MASFPVMVPLRVVAGVAAGLVLAACDPTATPDASGFRPQPREARAAQRRAIQPEARVENVAFGRSRERVARAIADLKRVGLWDDLTDHLYVVHVASRPGLGDVPDDGHLADAYLRAQIDARGQGGLCDIMFFPAALRADLVRWGAYHEQGLLDAPPSLRDFWGAILAHELAHCLPYENERGMPAQAPESVAERWEERALDLLRKAQP